MLDDFQNTKEAISDVKHTQAAYLFHEKEPEWQSFTVEAQRCTWSSSTPPRQQQLCRKWYPYSIDELPYAWEDTRPIFVKQTTAWKVSLEDLCAKDLVIASWLLRNSRNVKRQSLVGEEIDVCGKQDALKGAVVPFSSCTFILPSYLPQEAACSRMCSPQTHDVLPYQRPKSSRTMWQVTEICNITSEDMPFLFGSVRRHIHFSVHNQGKSLNLSQNYLQKSQ